MEEEMLQAIGKTTLTCFDPKTDDTVSRRLVERKRFEHDHDQTPTAGLACSPTIPDVTVDLSTTRRIPLRSSRSAGNNRFPFQFMKKFNFRKWINSSKTTVFESSQSIAIDLTVLMIQKSVNYLSILQVHSNFPLNS